MNQWVKKERRDWIEIVSAFPGKRLFGLRKLFGGGPVADSDFAKQRGSELANYLTKLFRNVAQF